MEETFEIEILRAVAGTGSWARVQERVEAFHDVSEALLAANREGLRGPLGHALIARGVQDESLRAAVHEEVIWNAQYVALLQSLEAALEPSGRRAVVLKGASLLPTAYQGKLGMRVLSDIDLFVCPRTLEVVGEALLGLGYQARADEPSTFSQKGLSVDLHEEITGRVEGAFNFNSEEIWNNSRPLNHYRSLSTLSPEDQWIHLAIHGTKHAFRRWIWLLDLALVWSSVEPERLQHRAQELQAQRVVTYAAVLLQEVVALPTLPEMVHLNRLERRFLQLIRERRASESMGKLIPIFSIPSLGGKARYLFRFLRPQTPLQSQRQRLAQVWQLAQGLLRRRLS